MFDSTNFLKTLSLKWSAKHTTEAARIERGEAIALAGKVAPRGPGSFRVAGSRGAEYTILVNNGWPSCTCPDFTEKHHRCKHIWACALMSRLTSEIVAQMSAPKPRPAQKPRRNNSLAEVIPLRK